MAPGRRSTKSCVLGASNYGSHFNGLRLCKKSVGLQAVGLPQDRLRLQAMNMEEKIEPSKGVQARAPFLITDLSRSDLGNEK